jgi:hypothetical protein
VTDERGDQLGVRRHGPDMLWGAISSSNLSARERANPNPNLLREAAADSSYKMRPPHPRWPTIHRNPSAGPDILPFNSCTTSCVLQRCMTRSLNKTALSFTPIKSPSSYYPTRANTFIATELLAWRHPQKRCVHSRHWPPPCTASVTTPHPHLTGVARGPIRIGPRVLCAGAAYRRCRLAAGPRYGSIRPC